MALTLSKVSATDLVKVVANLKGCQFVTVTTLSAPEMNKRGNAFYGRVLKLEKKYLQVNYGFENSCQNRQEKSGVERTYVAEPLPWGTWEVYPRVIDHKGRNTYASTNTTTRPRRKPLGWWTGAKPRPRKLQSSSRLYG